MDRNDEVRETLDALIREHGEDYAALSRMLGRNPSYIQQFIKYGVPRRLAEEDRRVLAEHFGVREEMLGKKSAPVQRSSATPQTQAHPEAKVRELNKNLVEIPYFNIAASAGTGTIADEERADQSLVFDAAWARALASASVSALCFLRVKGDSMIPTLSDGEQIVVDTADRERLRDGIYVLRIEDALYVKRIAVNPITRRLAIISDNPLHSQWPDCDPAGIDLIGRVVWVGRRL
jgi:phage repressor protein C with HTH and peptisase S24 domain